jgi:hypothetical protein
MLPLMEFDHPFYGKVIITVAQDQDEVRGSAR